jgi:hypothetical protein
MRVRPSVLPVLTLAGLCLSTESIAQDASSGELEHRVLATNKTSTMEKELNQAAEAGFRFQAVMGGDSAFGGTEVVIVMSRNGPVKGRYGYKLLATSKTSTMQTELQNAADSGYQYRGQTVFQTAFGGAEVVVILEQDGHDTQTRFDYRLLATSKTSTLDKELRQAAQGGYEVVGLTVGATAMGGRELVAITRRARR